MKYLKCLPILALTLCVACQPKGPAGTATDSSGAGAAPVAVVNGTPITRDFFEFYVKGATGRASSELTPEQRNNALDTLIRAELVAQQAATDGVDKLPETRGLLEVSRLNVLQGVMSDRYLKDKKPTEQEVRAEYENQVAALPKLEYHARHILVATQDYANKLIAQLDKTHGANFSEIAKRESMDPSKDQGGDLGWFTPDRMMKPFAEAVLSLKPGQYTEKPVQTQYGWHIIMLDETRDLAAPPFDNVKQRLEQVVQAKKFKAYQDGLMKTAKVEKKI